MSASSASARSSSLTRWLPWLGVGLGVLWLLGGAWLRRHSLDDSFINYRIVHQIQAGNGPVFNAGERVEAFTSPMWLGILTVGDYLLPFRLEWIGMVGGIIAGAVGFVLAALGSERLQRRANRPGLLIPLGALVIVAYPPTYRLIATGLETGLVLLWLGACALVLGTWASDDRRFGSFSAVLLGLGVLIRPDLAPFCATLLIAVLAAEWRTTRGHRVAIVASAAALPLATEILRMGYYGVLTPNTAIAKSADLTRWGKGWSYLTGAVDPYWFWLPAAILLVFGHVPLLIDGRARGHDARDVRRSLVGGAFLVGAVICVIYIVRVGGDYMQARLLLPAFFGFITPVMFIDAHRLPGWTRRGAIVFAVMWLIVIGGFVRTPSDDRATLFEAQNAVTLADFQSTFPAPIAPSTPPHSVHYLYDALPYAGARGATPIVIQLGIGKVGYALDDNVYVLDALGLATPFAAHERLRVRGYPGHEKLLSQPWMAALSTAPGSVVRESSFPIPAPITVGATSMHFVRQDLSGGRPFAERVARARGVLECRTITDFRASFEDPLTVGRFARNLLDAWHNQHVRIDGEPAIAARALCTPTERARIDHAVAAMKRSAP